MAAAMEQQPAEVMEAAEEQENLGPLPLDNLQVRCRACAPRQSLAAPRRAARTSRRAAPRPAGDGYRRR
jgi:hypothetical protein